MYESGFLAFTKWVSHRVLKCIRADDWRNSLLPVVCGHLYLAMLLTGEGFDVEALLTILLFLLSAVGFAATGYLINEFFDRPTDRHAGKPNRLAAVRPTHAALLGLVSLTLALVPWLWLPSNLLTWGLMAGELMLFILYAAPGLRWKDTPVLSNLTDAAYAYLIPMLLTFHTVHLTAGKPLPVSIAPYALAMSVVGLRNITVHQVNDLHVDSRTHLRSLPMLLGNRATSRLIILLLGTEVMLFMAATLLMALGQPVVMILPAILLGVTAYRLMWALPSWRTEGAANSSVRQVTDHFYQIEMPIAILMIFTLSNPLWTAVLFLHVSILVPRMVFQGIYGRMKRGTQTFWFSLAVPFYSNVIRPIVSTTINRSLWLAILLTFGTDLRNGNMSAKDFIKSRIHPSERARNSGG